MKPVLAVAALFFAANVHAEPAGMRVCARCHGAGGEGGATGGPRLAGQPKEYLLRQLAAYASGERRHGVMTPLAGSLSPQEREALAAYYAGLRAPTAPPQVGG